jgi:hypothetical protein
MHSCAVCCAVRSTGADPFGTDGSLPTTIVLDFLPTESLCTRKIEVSMQMHVKTPHFR